MREIAEAISINNKNNLTDINIICEGDGGADYINYCEKSMYESLDAKLPYEYVLDHENIWGSIKTCQAFGRILMEKYDIPAIEDEQWESTRDIYEHIVKNCELTHVTELADYLDKIRDERYTVFMAVADKSSLGLSEECRQKMSELGLQTDMNGLEMAGYHDGNQTVSVRQAFLPYSTSL